MWVSNKLDKALSRKNIIEHNNIFKNKDGTEVEFKIKTECSTTEEMRRTLSFMAQSSHRFYLETAEKISNTL